MTDTAETFKCASCQAELEHEGAHPASDCFYGRREYPRWTESGK